MLNRPRISHIGTRRGQKGKATLPAYLLLLLRLLFLAASLALVALYIHSPKSLFQNDVLVAEAIQTAPPKLFQQTAQRVAKTTNQAKTDPTAKYNLKSSVKPMLYQDWRMLAVNLAALPAEVVLAKLQTQDPFGVRQFEQRLLDEESNKGAFLNPEHLKDLFPCPADRITLPDQRNHSKITAFRDPMNPTYLFFQHLRKAGGTNFCTLAQDNLRRSSVASYFCMPDMEWSGNKCAGCLDSYTNAQIDRNMHAKGQSNSWK